MILTDLFLQVLFSNTMLWMFLFSLAVRSDLIWPLKSHGRCYMWPGSSRHPYPIETGPFAKTTLAIQCQHPARRPSCSILATESPLFLSAGQKMNEHNSLHCLRQLRQCSTLQDLPKPKWKRAARHNVDNSWSMWFWISCHLTNLDLMLCNLYVVSPLNPDAASVSH